MTSQIKHNISLAYSTSFKVGGIAKNLIEPANADELIDFLKNNSIEPIQTIGYGCNVLLSDDEFDGVMVVNRSGNIFFNDTEVVVDAGVWWDDVVSQAISKNLWGIELLSEVPGSFGGALFINITAYGQSVGPLVNWVEVWDKENHKLIRMNAVGLKWSYKESLFQNNTNLVIIRGSLSLSATKTHELTYQKALDVATELSLTTESLEDRRKIIIESRKRAGSIWRYDAIDEPRTVGSFFRNPIVSPDKAEQVIKFDESGKTREQILNMNKVHGGENTRISAAHVMLACGYKRGQTWGNKVKLNEKNLLKIEAINDASAQDIYNVARDIQNTCEEKLGINLEPEVQIIGRFKD